MEKKILVLIPARFQSTRYPGKPLVSLLGESMIYRVYKNMSQLSFRENERQYSFETYVVTDDARIEEHLIEKKAQVIRVDDDVVSGTLRIQLAYERFFKNKDFDLIINVQGDEPLLTYEEIRKLTLFHLQSNHDIATLIKRNEEFDKDFVDTNKVKVVISEEHSKALYFSRAAIPFNRDLTRAEDLYWYLHIGVYSYRPESLAHFSMAPESRLEKLEKLEQLRALEKGLSIGVLKTKAILMGIDTPSDLEKVSQYLKELGE